MLMSGIFYVNEMNIYVNEMNILYSWEEYFMLMRWIFYVLMMWIYYVNVILTHSFSLLVWNVSNLWHDSKMQFILSIIALVHLQINTLHPQWSFSVHNQTNVYFILQYNPLLNYPCTKYSRLSWVKSCFWYM